MDMANFTGSEAGRNYLEITPNEEDLLAMVEKNFSKVVATCRWIWRTSPDPEAGRNYLEITPNEEDLLAMVEKNFLRWIWRTSPDPRRVARRIFLTCRWIFELHRIRGGP